MTMTLAEFGTKYNLGPPVGGPPGLKGQCVALADLYAQEVFGDQEAEPFPENAVDIFGKRSAPGGYKWIKNDPNNLTQVPPRGALMVWGQSAAVGTGPLGHVDIVLDATSTYFNGFDQNWPLGAGPRIVRHSYVGVIGWGYPQIWDAQPIPIVPQQPVPPVVVVTYSVEAGDGFHVPHLVDLEDAKSVAVAYHNHALVAVNVNDEATGNSVWETTGGNG
jgi:hypothetical protein